MIDSEKILRKGGIKLNKRTLKKPSIDEVYPKERILGYTVKFENFRKPTYYIGTIDGMDIKAEGPTKLEVIDQIRVKLKNKYPHLNRMRQKETQWMVEFEGGVCIPVIASHRDEAINNARKFLRNSRVSYEVRSKANSRIIKAYPIR